MLGQDYQDVGSGPINLVWMVHRVCADARSKTAGRYVSFKALRQSSPGKPGESKGQTLYLQTPASNPLAGMPARPAGLSLDFTNITSAIPIKLIGPEPSVLKQSRKNIPVLDREW